METPTDLRTVPEMADQLVQPELQPAYAEVLRATRLWVLYGCGGFAVLCIFIGAAEALFGR